MRKLFDRHLQEEKRSTPGYPPNWKGADMDENLFTVGVGFPIPIIFVDARFKSARYLRYELNSFPIEKMPELRITLMEGLQGWNILFI